MNILVFDNYDSFTWNLVHSIKKQRGTKVDVCRNDEMNLDLVSKYDKIIISPGPGIPEEAGLLLSLLEVYATIKPVLGICLGHQAIAIHFGGSINNLSEVYHGIATTVKVSQTVKSPLFDQIPHEFTAGRYHSWVVNEKSLPAELQITARDESGIIMAIQHERYDVCGLQFHPESILTPHGETILQNWLKQ
jgi:anthranilate synthase component 2